MTSLWPRIEPLLAKVQKPARYIGCEEGSQTPHHAPHKAAWLLIYPDSYEVGLPNQGLQILYELLNERDDAVAERAYAPWSDMEGQLRSRGLPLFSVDTHRAAGDFDLLAFNLSAELVFTNLLNCVDLAGVPVRSDQRTPEHPLVVAGGHCTYNPEPLADFVDLFVIGDGEEVIAEITEIVAEWKLGGRTAGSRERVLRTLAAVPGVYVPSMYDVEYDGRRLVSVTPKHADVPARVEKRTIADLGAWPYPKSQLIPLTEVVHDRLNVEIFRGCTRGCRFCQAGMITRPVRERPVAQVRQMISDGLQRTGYDEVALTSLSSADYSGIDEVVKGVVNDPACGGQVGVSLPSLRVDAYTVGLAAEIAKVRRTGLTFAPEGGTWRIRQVISKLIREEDLYGAVDSAFSQGWQRVKLYFLIGLPTETDEDTLGIAELAKNCVAIGKKHTNRVTVSASVGGFVPKPQTPFQWFGQNTEDELRRKINLLRDATRKQHGVQLKWHDPKATLAEGIASRVTAGSAPSSKRSGATAASSRSGRSSSTSSSGRTPWPSTVSRSTGTSIATAPRTRSSRGTTSPPGSTRTSSGGTGRTPSPSPASRTVAGPRATTAARAPATGSSIASPLPPRRPGAPRAPARTWPPAVSSPSSC